MIKKIILVFYIVLTIQFVFSQNDAKLDLQAATKISRMKVDNKIPLRFTNALDAMPIKDANVSLENVGEFTTDDTGIIGLPFLSDGNYLVKFSKEGFISSEFEIRVTMGMVPSYRFSISPEIPPGNLRFVLEWNEKPKDLDIHFEKKNGYHISFRDMMNSDDGSVILDRDDMNGYGPETITIKDINSSEQYDLYIIDYSNKTDKLSSGLSKSNAVVRVFDNSGLLYNFTVPKNSRGLRWNVLKIIDGIIIPVGSIGGTEAGATPTTRFSPNGGIPPGFGNPFE